MEQIFKGPSYYTEEDIKHFLGRSEETKDLRYLVMHSDFSVCYAVSGEGKSSLINAGLCPSLREKDFFPIRISKFTGVSKDNLDVFVWKKIEEAVNNACNDSRYTELSFVDTITFDVKEELANKVWWKLRTSELRLNFYKTLTPVLIFDQFEELFTLSKSLSYVNDFFEWLEELYKDDCPLLELHGENMPKKFKLLISLRSEYVSELDYWVMNKHFIPSLKNNRYCLKPLTKSSAMEVARQLSVLPNGLNHEAIIQYAKAEHSGMEDIKNDLPCISALILSLLLTSLSDKDPEVEHRIAKGSGVDGKGLFDYLLDHVYEKALCACHVDNDPEAEKFLEALEDTLINADGRRRHASEKEFPTITDKQKVILNTLAESRIINIIDNQYEISHDSLCNVINRRKEQRHAREIEGLKLQQERMVRWKTILTRSFIIATIVGTCLLLMYCSMTTGNKYRQGSMLAAIDDHDFTTNDTLWLGKTNKLKDNAMVEQLYIVGKRSYTIDHCPYLHTVDLSRLQTSSLRLELKDCGQLEQLILPERLDTLQLSLTNCPLLAFTINSGLGYLEIDPTKESLNINVDKDVERYSMMQNIIWDIYDRRVVYYPQLASGDLRNKIQSVNFPPKIKCSSLKYGDMTLYNLDYEEPASEKFHSSSGKFINSQASLNRLISESERKNAISCNWIHLPDSLEYLPNTVFKEFRLDSIIMPQSLGSIGDESFMLCRHLAKVKLPNNLTRIGNGAFMQCQSLTHIIIPAMVTTIGEQAFEGCTKLESVEFLGDKVRLGKRAFANCPKLTNVKLPETVDCDFVSDYESPFYGTAHFKGKERFHGKQLEVMHKKGDYDIIVQDDGNTSIRLYDDVSEIFLPAHYLWDKVTFLPNVENLTHIHLPYPQPQRVVKGEVIHIVLNISKADKQHITLHVPHGCRRYYDMDTDYMDFLAIVEDSPEQERLYKWEGICLGSRNMMSNDWFPGGLLALLLFAISYFAQRKWWSRIKLSKPVKKGKAVTISVLFTLCVLLLFCLFLWFFIFLFSIPIVLREILAGVLSFLLTVMFFLAPQGVRFFEQIEQERKKDKTKKEPLRFHFRKIISCIVCWLSKNKKTVVVMIIIVLLLLTVILILCRCQAPKDFKTAMAEGNYQRAAQLFSDSLAKADTVTEGDRIYLRQLLAMAGDSARIIHIGSVHYDLCDVNYTTPCSVNRGISMIRNDSIYMFNGRQSAVWAKADDPFGRGNACWNEPSNLTVTYYDASVDSSAIIFLGDNKRVVKLKGSIWTTDFHMEMIVTKTADGSKLISDYQGRSIPFTLESNLTRGYSSGLSFWVLPDNRDFTYVHTEQGPTCMILPPGRSEGFYKKRYLIRKEEGKASLFAYDIQHPQKAPVALDSDGRFEVRPGVTEKFDRTSTSNVEIKTVDGRMMVVANQLGKSFPLPSRYANYAGTRSYNMIQNRYFWLGDTGYDEVAFFDFQQNGKVIAELKGSECNFVVGNNSVFYIVRGDSLQFYAIRNGRVTPTALVPGNKASTDKDLSILDSQYHILGNYLIYNEDCDQKAERYVRKVYSLSNCGAPPMTVSGKSIFACGDSLIIVNAPNHSFDFYRYESLDEQLHY